jgi:hypothetical protein
MRRIHPSVFRTLAFVVLPWLLGSAALAQIRVSVVQISTFGQVSCVEYVPDLGPLPCPAQSHLQEIVDRIGTGPSPGSIPVPAYLYLAEVDLSGQNLQVRVRGRNDACGFKEQVTTTGSMPLPIRLETTQEWAQREGVTLALNANFFKFSGSVRTNPCSELIGPSVSNGFLNWPPSGRPSFLDEKVDSKLTTSTLLLGRLDGKYRASIEPIHGFQQLDGVAAAVTGVPLVSDGKMAAELGPKGMDNVARTAVGLPSSGSLTLIMWEGAKSGFSGLQRSSGINLPGLASFLIELKAANALNLDGSGSSSFYSSRGGITIVSRTSDAEESMRPVVSSFGFVESPLEEKLVPYVYPLGPP